MSSKRRRHQPYDLDNPANWTVNKLKNELEIRGIKLITAVSKSALLQLYQQLCKPTNGSETLAVNADTINKQSLAEFLK